MRIVDAVLRDAFLARVAAGTAAVLGVLLLLGGGSLLLAFLYRDRSAFLHVAA